MPASVVGANPTVVMPYSLAVAFTESRAFEINENRYLNGEIQHGALVATSRKRFTLTKRLTGALLVALESFFTARRGREFWFYNVYETVPKFSYDITGTAVVGRYAVRFEGDFNQALQMGRNQAQLALTEIS